MPVFFLRFPCYLACSEMTNLQEFYMISISGSLYCPPDITSYTPPQALNSIHFHIESSRSFCYCKHVKN